jgi:putative peptidoglycan lipid II flippase
VTDTELGGIPEGPGLPAENSRGLAGATVGMAIGTTLSRITGVGRLIALAVALGQYATADAYNLANTTPNIITDIVIGGVLSATFVPVFVDWLSTRRGEEAWRAISAVTTVTIVVLAVATVAFWFLTPAIIDLYTVSNHTDVAQQRQVAVSLLHWFVPQLACYGLIGLFAALLNARHKFAAPMFVPIANNVIVIVVLLWFHALVPHPTLASVAHQHGPLVLLGLGTTLGVVVQAALLLPSLRRAHLHIHFRWEPAHQAMKTIVRLAGWTFAFVVSSQIALVVILALADGIRPPGQVSAYTYAYTFFQLPYGVVAVSVMSAVTPSLSARWALRDTTGFRHRLAFGMRGMLAIIIPSSIGMLILARPLIDLVLVHGSETSAQGASTAAALAMFALGLPGFCLFLYMVRVLQSMQDTRTAFYLYLVENGVNIIFGVALVGPLGVRGLALSISIAYTVAAVLALLVIRNRIGGLGGDNLTRPIKRVIGASAVMAVVTVLAVNVSSATHGIALLARVVLAVVAGALAYLATAGIAGARADRRRHEESAYLSTDHLGGGGRRYPPDPDDPEEDDGPYPPDDHPSGGRRYPPEPVGGGRRYPPGPGAAGQSRLPPSMAFRGRLEAERPGSSVRNIRRMEPEPRDDEEDFDGPGAGGNR